VIFLYNTLQLFKKPILLLQKTNTLFPELTGIIDSFNRLKPGLLKLWYAWGEEAECSRDFQALISLVLLTLEM